MIITGAILAVAAIVLLLKGKRAQSRSLTALGMIALILSIGVFMTNAIGVNWDRLKPYAVLEYEIKAAEESDPNRAAELTYEVKRRLSRSKLDPERLWPLVERALKAHKDPSAVWTPSALDLIETYDHWVGLSPEQILDFRKNSIRSVVEVRPEVRIGDMLPIQFRTWDSRTSNRFSTWKDYRILSCSLGGKALTPRYDDSSYWVRRSGESYPAESAFSQVHMDLADPGLGGEAGKGARLVTGLEAGSQPLVLEVEHRLHDFNTDEPFTTWVETIEASINVMPRRDNEARSDPVQCPIEGKVRVEAIYPERLSNGTTALWVYLNLDGVASGCSFEVIAQSAAGEIPLGLVHFIPPSDPTGAGDQSYYQLRMETNKRIIAEKANLVFRATPRAVDSSVRIMRPWTEEFVLHDVPIRWIPRSNPSIQMNTYLTGLSHQEFVSGVRTIDRDGRLVGAPEADGPHRR